ncbi:MAG TPA: MBL fold metallo-hydrolase [Ignavibacteriaceae bacterium]|jgi:Cft2 family RNA processing exonuclease|nr:MAG: Ribonuclease [Ignavibacteria bacterium ADurb.Bin266]OQY73013.1 MAG: exonuclease [Ignavibacteriales bacterium UTCHB2]HQF41364.1 MBL fold metallo-hydrolase [Ignavibacteriaceae bacterium]HQI41115.1 MBL fold metallo-hydrolase [Ignavibacteriaceae bacterium]
MISFLPIGGGNEIGANSYYLNFNGNGIILDCGIHPQKTGLQSLPDFNLLNDKQIDSCLISHAHQDHIGSLPFLIKKIPYVKIITTPQTRAIAELTLHNSVSILKKELDDEMFEFYSHDEIDLLIKMIEYKEYDKQFELNSYHQLKDSKVDVTFYDAGHVLGSAGILLENNNHKIFYSGDINLTDQTIQSKAKLPKHKIDTLILETTYGATDSDLLLNWQEESLRFAKEANKILNNGGSILIPVFSLGKMQEMLATIWLLMQKSKLTTVDIYTGGIGTKINRVYDYNRYVVDRIDKEFELSSIPQKDYYEITSSEEFFSHPCIVLASSGMMIKNTASYNFAKRFLRQNNSAIFTVGYMEPESPGYLIANSKRGNKIQLSDFDEAIEVKCEIKNFKFSAHARREDLLKIVDKLKPDNVILTHGDDEAIDWVGSSILKKHKKIRLLIAEIGKELKIFN